MKSEVSEISRGNIPLDQISLFSAVMTEIDRQGIKSLSAKQTNKIIRCVDEILAEVARPLSLPKEGMGLSAWLACDDVGMSARYMASVISGEFYSEPAWPHDADDFGRCVRMLDAIPAMRSGMQKMRICSPQWSRLISFWDDAEKAYRAEDFKRCSDLVKQAVGE